jgi:hypothetical protein
LDFPNKQLANRPGRPEMRLSEVAAYAVEPLWMAGVMRAFFRIAFQSDT